MPAVGTAIGVALRTEQLGCWAMWGREASIFVDLCCVWKLPAHLSDLCVCGKMNFISTVFLLCQLCEECIAPQNRQESCGENSSGLCTRWFGCNTSLLCLWQWCGGSLQCSLCFSGLEVKSWFDTFSKKNKNFNTSEIRIGWILSFFLLFACFPWKIEVEKVTFFHFFGIARSVLNPSVVLMPTMMVLMIASSQW